MATDDVDTLAALRSLQQEVAGLRSDIAKPRPAPRPPHPALVSMGRIEEALRTLVTEIHFLRGLPPGVVPVDVLDPLQSLAWDGRLHNASILLRGVLFGEGRR